MLRGLLIAFVVSSGAQAASANGAFPDAVQVLLAGDDVVLATNFGLVLSENGTWRWTCEHDTSLGGFLYQRLAPPSPRVMALSNSGLVYSDDIGCTWVATDQPRSVFPYDFFPDPGDPRRVLVLATLPTDGGTRTSALFESNDGGLTLGRILYQPDAGRVLASVEVARSDPRLIYLTVAPNGPREGPQVARSADGGTTWEVRDPGAGAGADLRIAAVDPGDPDTLYFRRITLGTEDLAISRDRGASIANSLVAPGRLSAFLRMDDGTLMIAAIESTTGHLYRSTDDGRTFAELPRPIRVRGFAERNGKVFAAADNLRDGFALAVSGDNGASWQAVMRFSDITGIRSCGTLATLCQAMCQSQVNNLIFPGRVCRAGPGGGGTSMPAKSSGCRAGSDGGSGPWPLALLLMGLLLRRR